MVAASLNYNRKNAGSGICAQSEEPQIFSAGISAEVRDTSPTRRPPHGRRHVGRGEAAPFPAGPRASGETDRPRGRLDGQLPHEGRAASPTDPRTRAITGIG